MHIIFLIISFGPHRQITCKSILALMLSGNIVEMLFFHNLAAICKCMI